MANCDSLSGGFNLNCDNNVGGVKKIWLLEKRRVTSVTLNSPTQEISAIVTSGNVNFYEFQFNKNTSSYTETYTSDPATGRDLAEQTITLVLNRREKTKRDLLLLLGRREDLCAIVEDNNGVVWFYGENFGLNMSNATGGSGTQKTDPNQYVITLTGQEPSPANTLTSACYTDITT